MLDDLCGNESGFEVTKADLPGYDKPLAGYRLECEGNLLRPDSEPDREEHAVRFDGPWIPTVPVFAASTRVHPIVFDYPWIDLTSIEVSAPRGYEPAGPPQPTKIESPFGSYLLKISALPHGYRVERAFAIVSTTLKSDAYEAFRGFLEVARRADRTPVSFHREGEAAGQR